MIHRKEEHVINVMEFACFKGTKDSLPNEDNLKFPFILTIDVNEILSIEQTENENLCLLTRRGGVTYYVAGNFRTINNRWLYTLESTISNFADDIKRPSIGFIHYANKMSSDVIYMDKFQFNAFKKALKNLRQKPVPLKPLKLKRTKPSKARPKEIESGH